MHEPGHLPGQPVRRLRHARLNDGDLLFQVRVVDPVVEAAPLQGVMHLPRPVAGDDDEGRPLRADGAELGDADLEVAEQLEQERLELLVGAVDLIDQEDRRNQIAVVDRIEQGPAEQELRAEDLTLGGAAIR